MKLISVFVCALCATGAFADTFYRCFWISSGNVNCDQFSDMPTCGTDLVTYKNKCEFSKAHCTDQSIDLKHYGACTDADNASGGPAAGGDVVFDFMCTSLSHTACPADISYVCGTDGRTYDNYCEYEKAKCTHRELGIKNYGQCSA